jgi:hypothetical protein
MHEQMPPSITTGYSINANSPILVNAWISDESDVDAAILMYTLDNWMSTPSNITMTFASGTLWECEIPWPGYNIDVQYIVVALDEFGNYGVSEIISIEGLDISTPSTIPTNHSSTSSPTTPTSPSYIVYTIDSTIFIIGGVGGLVIVVVVVYYLIRSGSKQTWR